eukprot:TRINITY_DN52266_c0_g1_i1.p2 TRINITY_DN52266_c0_g1~~TRINITY_DN52266_c0_g1_i1.p2  ORF type:complete len:230 (-),score=105.21 TRINITY_DN52266_c0_g1_i1:35-724(-)
MVQTGDPSGTGMGGESIYGAAGLKDEIHSRLKFDRRGLLGMASTGEAGSNGSQFFITMGACDWLTGKHTLFGKVEGESVYNAIRLQEGQIGEDDRPVHPKKIIRIRVVENPFEDIVPRSTPESRALQARLAEEEKKRKDRKKKKISKSKRKKQMALLSFGDEQNELEEEMEAALGDRNNVDKPPPLPPVSKSDAVEKQVADKKERKQETEEKRKKKKSIPSELAQAQYG